MYGSYGTISGKHGGQIRKFLQLGVLEESRTPICRACIVLTVYKPVTSPGLFYITPDNLYGIILDPCIFVPHTCGINYCLTSCPNTNMG